MPLMAVSECACPKSPPRDKAALVRRKAPLFLILAPRTAFAVPLPHPTLLPSVRIWTTTLRSWAADSMPFGRVGFGCDSLSSAALQIKSQEPSLLGKATPCLILLARSFQELTSAAPSSNPSRARRKARLFLTLSLQSQTRQRKNLCPATLFAASVSSFVPAGRDRIPVVPPFSGHHLLRSAVFHGVIRAFRQTARSSQTASSLCCLARSRLLRYHYGTHLASAAGFSRSNVVTVVPLFEDRCKWRSHPHHSLQPLPVRHLPRPTALPARDFCPSGFTADAVKPTLQKPPSPSILTHASAYCQNPPASPARKRHQGHTYLPG